MEEKAKAAGKEYHAAIRSRKKAHWDDFLAENSNIWKAARFLSPMSHFDKVPSLKKTNGEMAVEKEVQATVLLEGFFPCLPDHIDPEPVTQDRPPLDCERITADEIFQVIQRLSPLKAPGPDGLYQQ